jgi:hypothetical protein
LYLLELQQMLEMTSTFIYASYVVCKDNTHKPSDNAMVYPRSHGGY